MTLTEGTLYYDESQDRLYSHDYRGNEHYFHCGEFVQLREGGAWEDTRVEHSQRIGPYLVGFYQDGEIPWGLMVRFYA